MPMQPSLSTAIDGLYEAFRTVPKPRSIEGCPCCIHTVDRRRLLESPVRTIDPQALSPFAFKAMTTVGAADDLRYFVPRILEVCAEDPHWWPDVEIVMDRVTMAGWHSWPSRERAAIEALVHAVLASARAEGDGSGVLDAWICAASIAGIDVTACLEAMLDPTCRPALLAYWELNAREVEARRLGNAHWTRAPVMEQRIADWLRSDRVQAAIAAAHGSRAGGEKDALDPA